MKMQSTDKIDSFEKWRIEQVSKYRSFVWPQLNYNFSNANIISIVFEQKHNVNVTRSQSLINIINDSNIPYFVINFTDIESQYFIEPHDLAEKIGLTLTYSNVDFSKVYSYWDFRLKTVPTNCLSADIDSLEISDNSTLISVEAAQLFDTSSKQKAIEHIFRTFKRRKNQVNPQQYLAQKNFSVLVSGKAYILFHKIKSDNTLDDKSNCFLLENDEKFYKMLCFIKDECGRDDEKKFIDKFSEYLLNNLISKKDIYEAYDFIKSI